MAWGGWTVGRWRHAWDANKVGEVQKACSEPLWSLVPWDQTTASTVYKGARGTGESQQQWSPTPCGRPNCCLKGIFCALGQIQLHTGGEGTARFFLWKATFLIKQLSDDHSQEEILCW